MERSLAVASTLLFAATLVFTAPALAAPTGAPEELLVRFRASTPIERERATIRAAGAEPVDRIVPLGIHRVRAGRGAASVVTRRLRGLPEVEFVESDAAHAPAAVPNDPEYASQWALPLIGAPAAWDRSTGAPGSVIAILDSGIDGAHADLASKLVPGRNVYDGNADATDLSGHGTRVAGIAAAATNNGIGVAGIGWASPLMPVRVTDLAGWTYSSTMASGIVWAVDHGAKVLNLSFENMASSATIRSAAQYATSRGALVVAAAGNCGCDDPTPENPYILSVGATNVYDSLMSFSARGAFVDLVAPGTAIRTTAPGGGYVHVAGTSFASPVIAGVVALMMSANPTASPDEIVAALETTALDLGAAGHDPGFGFGRVVADRAVAAIASAGGPSPVDAIPPSAAITTPSSGTVAGVVVVDVTALDDRAVTSVELWVDGSRLATDAVAPYSFAWDTAAVSDGPHALVAVAVDAAGNRGSSAPLAVTVANAADRLPPTAVVASPLSGAIVSKTVTIDARASDDRALSRLDVLVDGTVVGGTTCAGTGCAVRVRWSSKTVAKGTHVVTARALDRAGNASSSLPVSVTVR